MSNSSWPYGLQPTRLLHPWDFPGKNTEVGCHCLLCVVQECAFFLLFTAASSHLSLEDLSSPMWQKVDLTLTHSDSDWANFLQGVKLAGANKKGTFKILQVKRAFSEEHPIPSQQLCSPQTWINLKQESKPHPEIKKSISNKNVWLYIFC